MSRLIRWLTLCLVVIIAIAWINFGWASSVMAVSSQTSDVPLCKVTDPKLDLNNANIAAFTDCPGFYPNLAQLIINNGPFNKVEDVLKIANLTDSQKALLKANLKSFMVSEQVVPLEMRMPPRPPGISH